jgi:hypothetical protein
LLTAIAFEHTDGAAGLGIQHRPKQRWLLIAIVTRLEGAYLEKTSFLNSLVMGGLPAVQCSIKSQSAQLFLDAWVELQNGMELKNGYWPKGHSLYQTRH